MEKGKIYTGAGDFGKTSLFSGERVSKSIERVEAYGDVDELNSFLGALAAMLPQEESQAIKEIEQIQSELLHIGAWLATTPGSPLLADLKAISDEHIKSLERGIDRMEEALPSLRGFILPGGHRSAAMAHVARTVCRRAERHVVELSREPSEKRRPERLRKVIVYLNRLSDYLFLLARWCNRIRSVPEVLWKK